MPKDVNNAVACDLASADLKLKWLGYYKLTNRYSNSIEQHRRELPRWMTR